MWRFLFLCTLSACASSPYDRAWVDKEVRGLTGYGIGNEQPSVPPGTSSVASLSDDDAVAIALWNSPRFRVELARLGFSRADLLEAGTLPNPALSFLFPVVTRQLEASLIAPVSALIQMPFRIAAAKIDVERTARAMLEVALDLCRDVRLAHAEVVLTARRFRLRSELRETWLHMTKLTEARLRAGDASDFELRTASAEVLIATEAMTRAENDTRIAKQRLRRLLGLGAAALGATIGVRDATPTVDPIPELETLEAHALAARPDVRAADIAVEAAAKRLGWERTKILQLFARLDAKPIGTAGAAPVVFPPGFQVELPIFNWNQGGRARAHAEIEQATMRNLAVREDVLTDVRVAHAQLTQAQASLSPWRDKVVPLLEANVRTAMVAYESGAETYIVVLDAMRREQEAKLRAIELEADVMRARAALARAVGQKP